MQRVTIDYVIGEVTTREMITGHLVTINLSESGRCVIQTYDPTGAPVGSYLYKEVHRIKREFNV